MMQALLEGVALRSAEVLDAMRSLFPLQGVLSVDGGLSRNAYFVQFLSEVAGQDLFLADETEQTARGLAAMVAESLMPAGPTPRAGLRVKSDATRRSARLETFAAARQSVEGFAGRGGGGPVAA
jgi:glycerol kinase